MSFTTDTYADIAADLRSKHNADAKSTAMRLITYNNRLKVAFAINKSSNLRSIYLSVNGDAKRKSFPKWKGVSIELAKLPDYGTEDIYVVLKELPNSVGYIFEIVAEDLRETIECVENPELSLGAVHEVLAKWKSFFQYDGEVLLSDIRQQGLMGELSFLKEMVSSIGLHAVAQWAGCNDETHDFYFNDHAVEIKTTSSKEPYRAHISSEYQLDTNDVEGKLYLVFFALRKSKSTGITLPEIVAQIRYQLVLSPAMLMQFNEKLHKYGYYDEVADLYTTGYYIREEYSFCVQEEFPCIISKQLKTGIANVEYSIGIDQCLKYQIEKDEMVSQLKGGIEYAE